MLSVFPAFENEQTCRSLYWGLKEAGLPVLEQHHAGATVIRAVRRSGGGLVLCGARLPDMTALQLSLILGDDALIVSLTHAFGRADPKEDRLLLLEMPPTMSELAQRVRILLRNEEERQRDLHRTRSAREEETIRQAKLFLAKHFGLDEGEAHRFLQRVSMQEGIRMSMAAQKIIET